MRNATNIAELVLPTVVKGNEKWLDLAIDQIFTQMATKCGHWLAVLANLRFVADLPSGDELIASSITPVCEITINDTIVSVDTDNEVSKLSSQETQCQEVNSPPPKKKKH